MFRIYPFLLSIACSTTKTTPEPESGNIVLDADGDGYDDTEDCDDNNSAINPSAEEICDSLDNNCDGDIDEGVQDEFFADSDNDGFGNPDISTFSCSTPDGFVSNGSDCDDTESFSYPGATETCDGIDNDCNGEIDDGLGATYYLDEDNDGFGDETNPISACSLDDGLATITGDCDDTNPAINPVAAELCDEIDNNCNGDIDEGVQNTYYADQDEDGYGSLDLIVYACTLPEDYVTITGDCNDIESLAYPGAIEYC
ncbi:MAG: putative metal-binding motif-containing protein, partial [Myxococcota bacterium]|nr:putative metal-binding motif-containing protein [Myxococcota bacterium]